MLSWVSRMVLATLACLCISTAAHAASERPNALDYRVNAIPAAQLLTQPATRLVDPARQDAAQRLVRWMLPGFILSLAIPIVVLAYFWQSGLAARLRDYIRLRTRSETWTRALFGATLGLLFQLAAAVPDFYIYRVERVMGLSGELFRGWFLSWLLATLFAIVLGSITVTLILWLVDRTHQWYLLTIAFIVAASLAIALLKPLVLAPFEARTQLPAQVAQRVQRLEAITGVGVPVDLALRGQQSSLGNITVEGIGPTQRIVVSDTLLAATTPQEFDWAILTQLGRIADGDPLHNALWTAAFIIFGAALAVFVSDRIGFRRDDDAVSRLALIAAFLGIVYLVVAPVNNALLQSQTAHADIFSARFRLPPAASVRAVVRMVDQRMDELCPSMGARLFLDRMPAPAERIASFNGTKNPCP